MRTLSLLNHTHLFPAGGKQKAYVMSAETAAREEATRERIIDLVAKGDGEWVRYRDTCRAVAKGFVPNETSVEVAQCMIDEGKLLRKGTGKSTDPFMIKLPSGTDSEGEVCRVICGQHPFGPSVFCCKKFFLSLFTT